MARRTVGRFFYGGSFMFLGQNLMSTSLLLAAAAGCSGVIDDTARTLVHEPLRFHSPSEHHHTRKSYRQMAAQAWGEFEIQNEGLLSQDFAAGFADGFVDFLAVGGSGEPPALPPREYWRADGSWSRRNAAVQEWFEGFRAGASVAQENGLREQISVPSSYGGLPLAIDGSEMDEFYLDLPPDDNQVEELPTPRLSSETARRPSRR